MTGNEIFKAMLHDPILQEKYGISKDQIKQITLSSRSGSDIIEMIQLVIIGLENQTPERSINSQIKNHFKI
ncbi:hypothetical protein GXP67_19650 [Rhodocytophaga rosea]|uniref:Uncharacterized protein n=1 Tax=Rhodocytophaga rosea TaxID=2704465 RepID=A0A6C0GL43_9BACT|nr:hypothetical protein [Rhodocytophaga rosea]QHT68699.1 hypothetical protein GXP67_19650 [Rhodocytophaga rosea]